MIKRLGANLLRVLPSKMAKGISEAVVKRLLDKYATIYTDGQEKLKVIQRPTLFICNHLSNSDGLVLNRVLKSVDPTFVAGVKLSGNAVTNIGMNVVKTTNIKPNSADKEGLKNLVTLVKNGESLLIFPEGTRSRVGQLIEAKKGILLIARMTGAPIVPLGLYGTEKLLPIDRDGKMGAESFQHADVHVKIGDQFDLPERQKGQDKKEYEDFAVTHLMHKISELLPESYQGVYKLN